MLEHRMFCLNTIPIHIYYLHSFISYKKKDTCI